MGITERDTDEELWSMESKTARDTERVPLRKPINLIQETSIHTIQCLHFTAQSIGLKITNVSTFLSYTGRISAVFMHAYVCTSKAAILEE